MTSSASSASSRRSMRSSVRSEAASQSSTKSLSGSSPLSSVTSSPKQPPAMKQPISGNRSLKTVGAQENSKSGSSKIFLRFTLKRSLPEAQSTKDEETSQPSPKRQRTTTAKAAISSTAETASLISGNNTGMAYTAPSPDIESLKAIAKGEKKFSEASIVTYALRQIYNSTPNLPPNKLMLISVPIETRREVMELTERFANYQASQGNNCSEQTRAIKLDLHLWEDGVPNVCRVQYPYFEDVMEKILFWTDRGRAYKVDPSSLANYEEAKAVKAAKAGNLATGEGQLREPERNSFVSELQALKNEEPAKGSPKDPTHRRLRAGILSIAERFCADQSKTGLNCTKLVEHLKADLHLCRGDVTKMREQKLATLSKAEIEAIMRKLPAWFRGVEIYEAGRRAIDMFASTWYEEYSAVHRQMTSLNLFTQ